MLQDSKLVQLENWQQNAVATWKYPALGIACAVFDAWKDCKKQASPWVVITVRFVMLRVAKIERFTDIHYIPIPERITIWNWAPSTSKDLNFRPLWELWVNVADAPVFSWPLISSSSVAAGMQLAG